VIEIKSKVELLVKRNNKYIVILRAIIDWEKTHPEKIRSGGWSMKDIPLTLIYWNGGFLNQLLRVGIIKKGYYSRQYHQFVLAKSWKIIEGILTEIEKEIQN